MAPAINVALRVLTNRATCRLSAPRRGPVAPKIGVCSHALPVPTRVAALHRKRVLCMGTGKDADSDQELNSAKNASGPKFYMISSPFFSMHVFK